MLDQLSPVQVIEMLKAKIKEIAEAGETRYIHCLQHLHKQKRIIDRDKNLTEFSKIRDITRRNMHGQHNGTSNSVDLRTLNPKNYKKKRS